MRINKKSARLAGIAAAAAALVLLFTIDGVNARSPARGGPLSNSTQNQNTIHPMIAKKDHGHKRGVRLSRLLDRPVYCACSYESCPEWIIVQCVGYTGHVRRETPLPRCICSTSDLTDPNYD
jgi:hypothetical protein